MRNALQHVTGRYTLFWASVQLGVLLGACSVFVWTWPVPAGVDQLTTAMLKDSSGQRVIDLPDDFRLRAYKGSSARYVLRFDATPQQRQRAALREPRAILLPSVRMNASVVVNGQPLSDPLRTGEPLARASRRPLLFSVPSSLLRERENRIEIELRTVTAGAGYLGAPLVGPLGVLTRESAQRYFALQTVPQIVIAGMTGIGALMLLLWRLRRSEPIYALYGVSMLFWAGHNLAFVVQYPPVPARVWDSWVYLSLGAFMATATVFIHRYLGVVRPRIEGVIAAFVVAGIPVFAFLPEHAFVVFGDRVWNPVVMSAGLYLNVYFHVEAWRRRATDLQILAASGTVIVVFGLHDLAISTGRAAWGTGYVLHYAAGVCLVVFTGLLITRFAQSLSAVERLNDELSARVTDASAEIAVNQGRVRELERARWLGEERERIARDMHDGVGGQLVALITRARIGTLTQPETELALSRAMEDLRVVIDSLQVDEGDLLTALATFRHRLERRLDGAGVVLRWAPGDLPALPGFGPADTLNLLRVLDEAASNALRHAQASELCMTFRVEAGRLLVVFADNGRGGAALSESGRGLRNMAHRAQALGATLRIESRPGSGTRIELDLPADRSRPPAPNQVKAPAE